jgi:xanthine dehydrogenase accessory factor
VIAPEAGAESFPGAEVIQNRDFSPGKIAIAPRTYVVVSTQGEGDEEALEQALNSSAAYVGFIASRTKARKVAEYLSAKGMEGDRVKRMRAPAGLDIHAASPEEIAVSILAEIVQLERSQSKAFEPVSGQVAPEQRVEARDPICGMEVDTSKAHKSEYQGNVFYFCCAGCKQTFDKQPESYAARFSG